MKTLITASLLVALLVQPAWQPAWAGQHKRVSRAPASSAELEKFGSPRLTRSFSDFKSIHLPCRYFALSHPLTAELSSFGPLHLPVRVDGERDLVPASFSPTF